MNLPATFSLDKKSVNVVIETPSGNRNKFEYDEKTEMFKLGKLLPGGTDFPYEMGFIPGTKGGDGDPLDALIIMEQPGYPGCFVECRLLGVIHAKQLEVTGEEQENDRFIAVPAVDRNFLKFQTLDDIKTEVEDLVRFFKNYNKAEGRKFSVTGMKGPRAAMRQIQKQLA